MRPDRRFWGVPGRTQAQGTAVTRRFQRTELDTRRWPCRSRCRWQRRRSPPGCRRSSWPWGAGAGEQQLMEAEVAAAPPRGHISLVAGLFYSPSSFLASSSIRRPRTLVASVEATNTSSKTKIGIPQNQKASDPCVAATIAIVSSTKIAEPTISN